MGKAVIPAKAGIQRKDVLQYVPTIFCMLMFLLQTFTSFSHADTNIVNIYDANGSLVTGDGNYYEYNDANQLVRVRQGDQNGAVIAEYFYDYSGQRIKKIENGVTTYYIGKHFEKQIGGTDAGNSSYYFAEGERVAKKDASGNIYYYHSDHLGGTNAVTDSAGNVVAKTDYMPFGEVKQGGTGNEKYSYTGKEKDKTDLYYFEARYNSTMFKHFTQADVASPDLSDPQDLNRYSYVGNNPMSYVDPDGFKKKKKHLSKREQRARALGLNPDKDKYKVGKMSDREYKLALKKHKAASKSKTSTASGATSDNNEYLYSVWLDFDRTVTVTGLALPSGWSGSVWNGTNTTIYLEASSTVFSYDIAAGNSLNGFSFMINYQEGNITYNAYFDDHSGNISTISGTTASVVPEPVSSILLLFGGVMLTVRNYLRRSKKSG